MMEGVGDGKLGRVYLEEVGSRSLGCVLALLPGSHEMSISATLCSAGHDSLTHRSPKAMEQANHRTKPLSPHKSLLLSQQ
jgi:hypothetical protein